MTQQQFWQIATQNRWNLEQMRFFIGERRNEPCCFGVYQDGEVWVVYKMKSSGEYVERYRGNEEEAFQIIYDKIHSEIQLRRAKGKIQGDGSGQPRKRKTNLFSAFITILVVAIFVVLISFAIRNQITRHRDGYYTVNDTLYYETHDDWYYYDDYYDDWYYVSSPQDWWYDEGVYSSYYDYGYGYSWEDSTWADDYTSYNDNNWNNDDDDDWGSDDWDTGDWDAGDTDWDSDW